MTDILERRRLERDELLGRARAYAEGLAGRMSVEAVVVAGSVARGDFNVWSDIDVVVVAEGLPERNLDRATLLLADAPAGVQPVGYTVEELVGQLERRNPLVVEAVEVGVTVAGDPLRALLADAEGRG